MSQHTTILTDDNFKSVIQQPGLVVVDFWAPWCPPCRALAPTIDALAQDNVGKAVIAKLNIDDNAHSAQAHGIRTIPTLLFFKNGKEVHKMIGAHPKEALQEAINQYA